MPGLFFNFLLCAFCASLWLFLIVHSAGYKIVKLASGVHSVHSLAERETFHPVIGPVAEAEALYVKQLRLPERLAEHTGEFVIWDVGLGAAANVLTVLHAIRNQTANPLTLSLSGKEGTGALALNSTAANHDHDSSPSPPSGEMAGVRGQSRSGAAGPQNTAPCPLRILSFDHTLEPLRFALENAAALGYFDGYQTVVETFLRDHKTTFSDGKRQIIWELHLGDFPSLIKNQNSQIKNLPPHSILFDAFSPAKNPAMWTQPLFADLFRLLDPKRPCALPTYSRSTMLRVSLLLAGFYVGVGHATGEKEETTIAANTLELLTEPLDQKWLQRARNSTSAEPMWEPIYRQAPLSEETWEKLRLHPQFIHHPSQ
jgi:S-adenosyl-L-methionine-dependent methyltransferase